MRSTRSTIGFLIPMYAFFALAISSLISTPARADDSSLRTISTSGEATVYVVPDEAFLTVGSQNFDADLDKAKAANDIASKNLVQAIKGVGIEDKYIATDRMNVSLHYSYGALDGYVVSRQYMVTIKDIKLIEKLVDSALKNGANQMGGIDFHTTDFRKYRDQARAMAVKAAKEKAVALAAELDCKVGKPRTILEGQAAIPMYQYASNSNSNSNSNALVESGGVGDENGSALPPGQIAVTANVSVTFDLE